MTPIKEQERINNDYSDRLAWLEDHWSNFNSEMGKVQTDVGWLRQEVERVREGLEDINNKILYGFIITIGLTIVAQICIKFFQ